MPTIAKIRPFCVNNCGRKIKPQSTAFCSRPCQLEYYRRRMVDLWKAGELPPRLYFNRTVRRHIIEAAGEKCERCGWRERNPFTGKIPLEIEHVDGDWQNNAPANIRVLCPNCHALTATFRGANKGRGRPGRPGLRNGTEVPPHARIRWTDPTREQPLFSALIVDFDRGGTLVARAAIMTATRCAPLELLLWLAARQLVALTRMRPEPIQPLWQTPLS